MTEEERLETTVKAARGDFITADQCCAECGLEISSQRQIEYMGCILCTECAEDYERT